MLSVVTTVASPLSPAICIASLAMTRGARRRSFVDLDMTLTLPAASRPLRSATPAWTSRPRAFLRTPGPLRPPRSARPQSKLDFSSFQIRSRDHDVHGVAQPEPVPRPLGAEGEPL